MGSGTATIARASYQGRASGRVILFRRLICAKASLEAPVARQLHPLISWVKESGGVVHDSVAITCTQDSGFGLYSSQNCSKGTKIVSLPRECQLSYAENSQDETFKTSPALLALIQQIPPSFWGLRLAVRLLEQRAMGETSPFNIYIRHLPSMVQSMPMFFSPNAIKALWYAPLQAELAKRGRFMAKFHREAMAPKSKGFGGVFNGVTIDLNGLGWALSVVTSRAFATQGPRKPRALLPMIDMCNHRFDPNCDIQTEDDGSVVLIATQSIQSGDELVLSYGKLDNHTLLLDYGFMVYDNPYDNISVLFDVDAVKKAAACASTSSLEPQKWQKEQLIKLGVLGEGAHPACSVGRGLPSGPLTHGVDVRLLSAMEIMCAPSAQALEEGSKLRLLVRTASLALLKLYLESVFEQSGLDIAETQVLFQKADLPADMRVALQHRLYKMLMLEEAYQSLGSAAAKAAQEAGCATSEKSADSFKAAMELLLSTYRAQSSSGRTNCAEDA